MAKSINKVVIPPHVPPKYEYIIFIGENYYRRLQPVPYRYVKPNFKRYNKT